MPVDKSSLQFNYANFDFSEFRDFYLEFDSKVKNFKEWMRWFLRKEAEPVLQEAIKRTPVDTGLLKASWQPVRISIKGDEIMAVFENFAMNSVEVEYGGWVEHGHAKPYKAGASPGSKDWVDGKFMLTVPLNRFLEELPEKFEADFWRYMERKEKRGFSR